MFRTDLYDIESKWIFLWIKQSGLLLRFQNFGFHTSHSSLVFCNAMNWLTKILVFLVVLLWNVHIIYAPFWGYWVLLLFQGTSVVFERNNCQMRKLNFHKCKMPSFRVKKRKVFTRSFKFWNCVVQKSDWPGLFNRKKWESCFWLVWFTPKTWGKKELLKIYNLSGTLFWIAEILYWYFYLINLETTILKIKNIRV